MEGCAGWICGMFYYEHKSFPRTLLRRPLTTHWLEQAHDQAGKISRFTASVVEEDREKRVGMGVE